MVVSIVHAMHMAPGLPLSLTLSYLCSIIKPGFISTLVRGSEFVVGVVASNMLSDMFEHENSMAGEGIELVSKKTMIELLDIMQRPQSILVASCG
jgi:hypothetical protein